MITLDAKNFIMLLHTLLATEMRARHLTGPMTGEFREVANAQTLKLIEYMEELDLEHSIKTARQLVIDAPTGEKFHEGMTHLVTTVMLEAEGRKYYGPVREYQKYYEQQELFAPLCLQISLLQTMIFTKLGCALRSSEPRRA
jgi:hypothetical protein